jgi:hypothetical protein
MNLHHLVEKSLGLSSIPKNTLQNACLSLGERAIAFCFLKKVRSAGCDNRLRACEIVDQQINEAFLFISIVPGILCI